MGYSPWGLRVRHDLATEQQQTRTGTLEMGCRESGGLEGLPSSCHTMNSWQVELAGNSASKKVIEVVGEARPVGIQEKWSVRTFTSHSLRKINPGTVD